MESKQLSSEHASSSKETALAEVEEVYFDEETFKSLLSKLEDDLDLEECEEAGLVVVDEKKTSIFDLAAAPQFASRQLGVVCQVIQPMNTAFSVESATPVMSMSPEIADFFEHLVGLTSNLFVSGDQETTFFLDSTFSSPLFHGAEITLYEYSSAPRVYNVQIKACAEAIALIQGQSGNLMQLVEEKRLPFRFHRIEASCKEEALKRRKVKAVSDQRFDDGTLS